MGLDDLEQEPKGLELYEWWDEQIDNTLKFVKENYWPLWEKWLRLDRGDHWGPYQEEDRKYASSDNPMRQITVNLIGPYNRQLKAYAVSRDPYISVKPTSAQEAQSAILQEVIVNYEFRRRNFKKGLKSIFIDGAIFGFGIGKLGWTKDVDTTAAPNEDGFLDYASVVKENAPFFKRVSPFCFLYDLSSPEKNLDTARWCCEIFFQDPLYVINNENYNPRVRAAIKSGAEKPETGGEVYPGEETKNQPKAVKRLWTMYELWDRKYRKRYIFCRGVKRPLVEEAWPWDYIDGLPYKMFTFIESVNDWYPFGLPLWIEDQQYELNRIRTALFDFRRKNPGGQYLVDSESITDAEVKKLNAGTKYAKADLKSGPAIVASPLSQMPQEHYLADRMCMSDMDRMTGLSDITQGASSPGRRAATEIKARTQFTMLRIDGIVSNFDEFVEAVARELIQHIKANYDSDKAIMIAGPLGEYWGRVTGMPPGPDGKYWHPFTRDEIQGEFDITIESTAKSKADPTIEQGQKIQYGTFLFQLAQFGAQIAQAQMTLQNVAGINLEEVAKWIAESFPFRDVARLIPGARIVQPPIQEQTAFDLQQSAIPFQQQPQTVRPPVQPAESQMFRQAANPESGMMGQLLGRFNMPQGEGQ